MGSTSSSGLHPVNTLEATGFIEYIKTYLKWTSINCSAQIVHRIASFEATRWLYLMRFEYCQLQQYIRNIKESYMRSPRSV